MSPDPHKRLRPGKPAWSGKPPPRRGGSRKRAGKKAPIRTTIHGMIWLERGGRKSLTPAGADLLEQIEACGSLSEAARRLRYAYRRAWMLIDAMNRSWPQPLVRTSIGGRRGGGARLTETGRRVLHTYRDLQVQLEHLLDLAGQPF